MSLDAWLSFDVQGDLLESARECEAEVFLRWYGNTRSELEDEYGPYEDSSVYMAVSDDSGEVVATMRLLVPGGSAGLKTLHDIGRAPWGVDGSRAGNLAGLDLGSTIEIATISSRRKSTAHGLRHSFALYRGLVLASRANQFTSLVAILDDRVRRLLDTVGLVTLPLPGTGPAPYLGSEASTPVFAHGPAILDNQRRASPEAFALVSQGIGLDGISVPQEDEFRLRCGAAAELMPAWSAPTPISVG